MKKRLIKLVAYFLGSLFVLLLATAGIIYVSLHKKIPEGTPGNEADTIAIKIQDAVHHTAYLNTDYIQWTFLNKHHYLWNKKMNIVDVRWGDYEVNLHLNNLKKSTVFENNIPFTSLIKEEILQKALTYFYNDSFWIVAPHKLFDEGTTRKVVSLENGSKGLLVTYTAGGLTPGDSYLWKYNDAYLPTSFIMWASILPIGGIEATWENWTYTDSGAYFSSTHKILGFGIPISNLKAWND
ncbi:hypothetical protein HN014_16730 [Aquimarina sp. TRL1]|uniref:hypothetical protein n=1 Tax=Aquimarina sp. (strain TRL1) TaxID=2736252 RepID=UPI00158A9CC3|nr:hypothetical protein [Aquimarina sp. TRL1]QKX06489.1 hypothetical protein HN014_16730 [Aquimarina sp. TRL1]